MLPVAQSNGIQMGQAYQRKGSLAYRPRKRAHNQMPRVNFWPANDDKRLMGFAGYKAGMTTISYIDDSKSPNAGNEIFGPVTIVEVPSMVVYGVRGMKMNQTVGDVITSDEKILKELDLKNTKKNQLKAENVSEVLILAYTRPEECGFGKKRPERMMIGLGGKNPAEKLEFALSLLGKEVKASEVFKVGEYVDTVSITSGKGWQGTVKRFGTHMQRRKSTGKRRHVGTLGPWHPGYVQYTVPRPGQMGYHKRTDYSKRIVKILSPAEINPSGGFPHYGLIKNECLLLYGSISGPVKRLIRMRKATREPGIKVPDVRYISLEAKN